MANYFRITAYHPAKNICAIFDSNGRFEKLWQFSAYLVQKGFKIVEVGADDKFLDGNIPSSTGISRRFPRAIILSYAPAQRESPLSTAIPLR